MYTLFFLALSKLQNLVNGARELLSDITTDWSKEGGVWCETPCSETYPGCYCRKRWADDE